MSIVTVVFYCCLFASFRARKLGQRNMPVLFQAGMVASNLTMIILLGRQWYSYHVAFFTLDKQRPNQIQVPVLIASSRDVISLFLISCVIFTVFIGLWCPNVILRESQLDEEARHSYAGTEYNPHLYNQPFRSWVSQLSLACAWIITCVSMQAKLPGATYANMKDAYLFPPSRLELSLNALAMAHLFLGIGGWMILALGVFLFGKTLVLLRVDLTSRCKRTWGVIKADYKVRMANEEALKASRVTARSASWPSSFSSSSLSGTAGLSSGERGADAEGDTHIEMESMSTLNGSREEWREQEVVDRPFSWEAGDDSLDIPQSAKLRN